MKHRCALGCPRRRALCLAVICSAAMAAAAVVARGQGVSPVDAREQARFEAVQRMVAGKGYAGPVVVGVSPGPTAALFALLATTRMGNGVLVVASEAAGTEAGQVVEVETDKTPADLGVRGIRFERFLGRTDFVDVVVGHRPFRLEVSFEQERHHVLRRRGAAIALACGFDGGMSSSFAKGPRSVVGTRVVTVEEMPAAGSAAGTLTFDVVAVDEQVESGVSASPEKRRTETRARYQLPLAGVCVAPEPVPQPGT